MRISRRVVAVALLFLGLTIIPVLAAPDAPQISEDEAREAMRAKTSLEIAARNDLSWEELGRAIPLRGLKLEYTATDEDVGETILKTGITREKAAMSILRRVELEIAQAFLEGNPNRAYEVFVKMLAEVHAKLVAYLNLPRGSSWEAIRRVSALKQLGLERDYSGDGVARMSVGEIGRYFVAQWRESFAGNLDMPREAPWEELFRRVWMREVGLPDDAPTTTWRDIFILDAANTK